MTSRHSSFPRIKINCCISIQFAKNLVFFVPFIQHFLNSNEKCESCNYFSNRNLCGDFAHPFSVKLQKKTIYMQIRERPQQDSFFILYVLINLNFSRPFLSNFLLLILKIHGNLNIHIFNYVIFIEFSFFFRKNVFNFHQKPDEKNFC